MNIGFDLKWLGLTRPFVVIAGKCAHDHNNRKLSSSPHEANDVAIEILSSQCPVINAVRQEIR